MITLPSSKSYTQRAIVIAALANGPSQICQALECDDSRVLIAALRRLGVTIEWEKGDLVITPPNEWQAPHMPLYLENAGTSVRFLSALSLLLPGEITIDGSERMRARPMSGLIDALRQLGMQATFSGQPMCPPLTFSRKGAGSISMVRLNATQSSQQLSALLMVAPLLPAGLKIELSTALPSKPYVDMTIDVMEHFGAKVNVTGNAYHVPHGHYEGKSYRIEGDWSSASYPLTAMMLTGRYFNISNLNSYSKQPDRLIASLLVRLNESGEVEINLNEAPDIVPTVALYALFRHERTIVTHISHLRLKECDRLHVLATELRKVGANITEWPDGLAIQPAALHGDVTLDSHDDHRMAMAFGLLQLKLPNITITHPECVSKSYPNFWKMLEYFR